VGYELEGDVHAFNKSWSEAAAAYRTGLKQTGATELAIKLHAVLMAGGHAGEADKFADGWMRDHAKDFQFRLYLAETATARKDYAAASKHYRVLLEAQPNNPTLMNNLAWCLAQNKDPRAIEYAEKANQLAPDQPALMDTLGVLLVDKGETARGLELLQKAISLAPQSASIRFNLAKSLLKAGKKSEAKKELDELAKLGDKFPAHAEVAESLKGL
jgi:putative PEP-CTERM system TPR-repeat lipoprotein